MSASDTRRRAPSLLDAWLAPSVVALPWLALAVVPRAFGPLAAELAAALALPLLTWWALRRMRRPSRPLATALGLSALAVALLAVSALLAADPKVSLLGMIGQHLGVLLWVLLLLWLTAFALGADAGDARRCMKTVATLGALAAAAMLLDRLGIIGHAGRYSTAPSGVFENSLSLAQALLLASACAAGWWWGTKGTAEGRAAAVLLAANLAGLLATGSSGALAGAVAGAAVLLALAGSRREIAIARLIPAALLVAALLAGAGGTLLYAGRLPATTYSRLDGALNGRLSIWDAAVHRVAQRPLLGAGPDQFSAWATWRVGERGALETQAAYDPHDAVLGWLVSGGFVGLAAASAAGIALYAAFALALRRTRAGVPSAAIPAALAGFAVACVSAWLNPTAALTAAALGGCLLALGEPKRNERRPAATGVLGGALVALLVLALLAAASPMTALEYSWSRSFEAPAAVPDDAFARWPDPAFAHILATRGLGVLAASATTAGTGRVSGSLAAAGEQRRWHVDVALDTAEAARLEDRLLHDDTWAAFEAAIADGKLADPASGLWDYVAAREEASAGRAAKARVYARQALEHPLPDEAAAELRALLR